LKLNLADIVRLISDWQLHLGLSPIEREDKCKRFRERVALL
jgi:hypothetical protein